MILTVILNKCGILHPVHSTQAFQKKRIIFFEEQFHRHLSDVLAGGLRLNKILYLAEGTDNVFHSFLSGIVDDYDIDTTFELMFLKENNQ